MNKLTIMRDTDPIGPYHRAQWLEYTADKLVEHFVAKFNDGAQKYGCDIGELTVARLLEEMEQEALDQLAYVRELKRRFVQTTESNESKLHAFRPDSRGVCIDCGEVASPNHECGKTVTYQL